MTAFAATKARTINAFDGVGQATAVADVSSGDTQEVDSDGSAQIQEEVKQKGTLSDDGTLVGASCTFYGYQVFGSLAGDYVHIYDDNSATGTAVFKVYVGTAADSKAFFIPGGVPFSTNVYLDFKNSGLDATIIYDNNA